MLVDSHAHLTSSEFDEDIDAVLKRAQEEGVERIYNICTHPDELKKAIALHQKYSWVLNVASTTPHDALQDNDATFEIFSKAAQNGDIVAVGETGLDYHYDFAPREKQRQLLNKYMNLALEASLPLVIHCREAFSDLFDMFKGYEGKVLLHCFTGTKKEAHIALDRGFFISFSGIVTFKKSKELQEVAHSIPYSHMLIETDAPYLAPQSKRGTRNEPSYIKETASFLASLKGFSEEEFSAIITKNALSFFGQA